jgi:SAM-dependent methyltransferase
MRENRYSPTWFEFFLRRIPPEQTRREVEFLARQLPLPAFANVLDICCGEGRHAAGISRLGYAVTGVDRDGTAIARARANAPAAQFVVGDMRELAALLRGPFDAAVCLWQSFGYFDAETNAAILRDIATLLRPAGRLVLDVYHRLYFESRAGEREFEINGKQIVERRTVTDGQLRVELSFDKAEVDLFQWQIYSPEELIQVCASAGLSLVLACSGFDETKPPSDQTARYQLVLQRQEHGRLGHGLVETKKHGRDAHATGRTRHRVGARRT